MRDKLEWSGVSSVDRHTQKLGQRAAVFAPPGNAALRTEALKVADQNHAKVNAGRDRSASHLGRVIRTAQIPSTVEVGFSQQTFSFCKRGGLETSEFRGRNPSRLLLPFPFAKAMRVPPAVSERVLPLKYHGRQGAHFQQAAN